MRNFIDIVEQTLEEGGPSRLMTHIRKGTPFFMISAFRANLPEEVNHKRSEILKQNLTKIAALTFMEIDGCYWEDGQEESKDEKSFFVMPRSSTTNITKFLKIGKQLMDVFDQQAIMTGDGEEVRLLFANGESEDVGSVATFDWQAVRAMPNHSAIDRRPFGFTTTDKAPAGIKYGIDRNPPQRAYC